MFQLRASGTPEKRFLNYILKECLGSGSFGVVWKVEKRKSKTEFALKMSLVEKSDEEKQKREFEIAVQLQHDKLVKAYEWNKEEITAAELDYLIPANMNCHKLIAAVREKRNVEICWMRMELCGENLRSWLQLKHDPLRKKVQDMQHKIVRGMVQGVNFLHSKRIMHRDLKPENIIFAHDGFSLPVKIGDYGSSRIRSETEASVLTSGVGTDLYKAPEARSNNYDFKSDIFSTGLIIWEVIQFIPVADLRKYFDQLVYDKQEQLVKPLENSVDFIFTPLVKAMCLKDVKERLGNLDNITDRLNFRFSVNTSEELEEITKICGDGWTILLEKGTFEGSFGISADNVTISGSGKDTVLIGKGTNIYALMFSGNKIRCSNFQINGNAACGIFVSGGSCTFKRLNIIHCLVGFACYFFRNNSGNISVEEVDIATTEIGILICHANRATLSSVKITNPGICGTIFANVTSTVELSGVQVDLTTHHNAIDSRRSERIQVEKNLIQCPVSITRPDSLYGILISKSSCGKFIFRDVKCTGFNDRKGFVAGLLVEDDSVNCHLEMINAPIEKLVFENNFPVT